jgi:Vanillate O-demethylase oxygenase C-terminal domain
VVVLAVRPGLGSADHTETGLWARIGDKDRAAETRIPRAPWLDSPGQTTVRGMEPLNARYELLVDNLLDLSHETYLHGGYIGTPEVAHTPITTEVDDEAGIVYVSRHMDDAECPPFYARSAGLEGRIVRWQDIEFFPPCLYLLHSRVARSGSIRTMTAQTRRLPCRGRLRDHPRDRDNHARLLGRRPRLRFGRRGDLGLPRSLARSLGVNSGRSCVGPGVQNIVNLRIARAISLCLNNFGRWSSGVMDLDTIGTARKHSAVIAENVAESPWPMAGCC